MSLKAEIQTKKISQEWSPRPLNRGEPFDILSYSIYFRDTKFFAKEPVRVFVHYEVKKKTKGLNKLMRLVDAKDQTKPLKFQDKYVHHEYVITREFKGDEDLVYSEVLKILPDNELVNFNTKWTNAKLDFINGADLTILGKAIQDELTNTKSKAKPDLVVGNKQVEIKVNREKKEIIDLGYFNYKNENQILADKVRSSDKDISEIANAVGLHVTMVSKQIKGLRDITRDHAFRYAKLFGCDPADILFAAPQIPIWSTVNFLDYTQHEMPFNPGECVAITGEREQVVVPRDIYRPDIKAVKVNSPGSYLDGMVLFYYATSDVKQDCYGRLSIVGDEDDLDDELMQELRFGEKQRYFIGILEQYKGKTKLLNPDPYAKENLPKEQGDIIINNITPNFASPIVGIVNPSQIKKDKHSSKLFKANEEVFKTTRLNEQLYKQELELKEARLQKEKDQLEDKLKRKLQQEIKKQEKLLLELQKKVDEQNKKNVSNGIMDLFYKADNPINKKNVDRFEKFFSESKKNRA